MNEADPIHELLPWYAAGTLGDQDAERFRLHLEGCESCRDELAVFECVQEGVARHGGAFLGDHPPAEALVAAARDELPESRAAEVRQHLQICSSCAAETDWITGQAVAELAGARTLSRYWLPAAAAVLLVGVLLVPLLTRQEPPAGGPSKVLFLKTERAGTGAHVYELQDDTDKVRLRLTADFSDDAFPLRFEIRDDRGSVVLAVQEITRAELTAGTDLTVACDPVDCGPGSYSVRLTSSDGRDQIVYGLQVTRGSRP